MNYMYEVLSILGWQNRGVVALAKVRTPEEDRGNMERTTW